MIDTSTYRRIHKSSHWNDSNVVRAMPNSNNYDSWPIEVRVTEAVNDSILMILSPCILGFEMQAKKWGMPGYDFSVICCELHC